MAKKRNRYEDSKGHAIPGVTTVTGILNKPALVPWAASEAVKHVAKFWKPGQSYEKEIIDVVLQDAKNAHRTRKTDAADFGTDIHALVESYIGKQIVPEQVMDASQRRGLENFISVTAGWEWLGAEIVVIHEDPEELEKGITPCGSYGGTADGLARLPNGMIVLTDTKTSSGVYPEFDLQIAMYAYAEPMNKDLVDAWSKIEEARILHFDKERITWEVLERDVKSLFHFIPHLREVYEWKKRFANDWS